ncbi:hypothetical protein AJ78_03800 [Emergomyces pasteurianus Ep9510]|uniref:Uncharacterized protein n=1 Tax=Emergomyces pasteurianus Ep9510 TaxID=1447872 RepID=A0A1J9PHT6_9EURO|nr:hypothetical protein AJ78_03800 [Emergomyces pasteurianus Ep9510]
MTIRLFDYSTIRRSAGCRLLFLTGSEVHCGVPVCPGNHLGRCLCLTRTQRFEHILIAKGRCLRYVNWPWNLENYPKLEDEGYDSGYQAEQHLDEESSGDDGLDDVNGTDPGLRNSIEDWLETMEHCDDVDMFAFSMAYPDSLGQFGQVNPMR